MQTASLASSGAFFDIKGTGIAIHTGWLASGANEGFLAVTNADGSITSISNLFGTDSSTPDGFAALAKLDSNKDGVIDANDAQFANLVIWDDANGDGISEQGETETLSQAGVTSISLSKTTVATTDPSYNNNGNEIRQTATVTMADGSTREIADVWFAVDPSSSRWLYTAPSAADSVLPDIAATGSLDSLQQSYALDPTLESMAQSLAQNASTMTLAQVEAAAQSLIYEWAGVTNVPTGARGEYIDAQHMGVLEKIFGEPFTQTGAFTTNSYGIGPGADAGPQLEALYQSIVPAWQAAIATQLAQSGDLSSGLTAEFAGLSYDVATDSFSIADGASIETLEATGLLPQFIKNFIAAGASLSGAPNDDLLWAQVAAWYAAQPAGFDPLPSELLFSPEGSTLAPGVGYIDYIQPGVSSSVSASSNYDLFVLPKDVGSYRFQYTPTSTSFHVIDLPDVASTDVTLLGNYNGGASEVGLQIDSTGAVIDLATEVAGRGNVQEIAFSDGVVWTQATIASYFAAHPLVFSTPNSSGVITSNWTGPSVYEGGAGNDQIKAVGSINAIDGGAGDDALTGSSSGADTFLYADGDGNDTISTYSKTTLADTLDFTNLTKSQVSFTMSGTSLVARDLQTAGSVTIYSEFGSEAPASVNNAGYGIENFQFMDGVMTRSDVLHAIVPTQTLVLNTTTLNASVTASAASVISSTGTESNLYGSNFNDVLIAGSQDKLQGGQGSDLYEYGVGAGVNTITDIGTADPSDVDTLAFGAGITPNMITASYVNDNVGSILLKIADGQASDQVTLTDWMDFQAPLGVANDKVMFADGTVWTQPELADFLLSQEETSGADTVYGDYRNNFIDGGKGNDMLRGEYGDDTYFFTPGDGQDTIFDPYNVVGDKIEFDPAASAPVLSSNMSIAQSGTNIVLGYGTGDIITLQNWLNETGATDLGSLAVVRDSIVFSDGSTMSYAAVVAASMIGTSSANTINGTGGNDIIRGGAGNDTLAGGAGDDTYLFAVGDGADTVNDTSNVNGDTIQFDANSNVLASNISLSSSGSTMVLKYGSSDSIQLQNWMQTTGANATSNDKIVFSDGSVMTEARAEAIIMAGTSGNDTIYGTYQSDTIGGGPGNDTIYGEAGNDTLRGGPGNDLLEGGAGDDTYLFSVGDGQDEILDSSNVNGDVIEFDPSQASAVTAANISVTQNSNKLVVHYGSSDAITFDNALFTTSALASSYSAIGNDTLVFTDGTSLTRAQLAQLSMAGSTGTQTITAEYGGSILIAGSGTDTLVGEAGKDILRAGAGTDLMEGGAGDDVYVVTQGHGALTVTDSSNINGDVVMFDPAGPAETAVNVTFTQNGTSIVMHDSAGSTTLSNWLFETSSEASTYSAIARDQIKFTDGSSMTQAQVEAASMIGNSSANTIEGTPSADILQGAGGNDTIYGNGGGDTFVFNVGDGQDVWYSAIGSQDTIKLGSGITYAGMSATQSGSNLILKTGTGTDQITLESAIGTTAAAAFDGDTFQFADGSTHSFEDFFSQTLNGSAGSKTIKGDYASNTITGGPGDTLTGYGGSDDFVFNAGFGKDTVTDFTPTGSSADVIDLASSIFGSYSALQSAGAITQSGSNTLITKDASDVITLTGVTASTLTSANFAFH